MHRVQAPFISRAIDLFLVVLVCCGRFQAPAPVGFAPPSPLIWLPPNSYLVVVHYSCGRFGPCVRLQGQVAPAIQSVPSMEAHRSDKGMLWMNGSLLDSPHSHSTRYWGLNNSGASPAISNRTTEREHDESGACVRWREANGGMIACAERWPSATEGLPWTNCTAQPTIDVNARIRAVRTPQNCAQAGRSQTSWQPPSRPRARREGRRGRRRERASIV